MHLDQDTFSLIIKHTPLISIDLVIENEESKFLLGKRINRPAKGFWFVPGGRIYKDESLTSAFQRITHSELGLSLFLNDSKFLGIYEHFYNDNYVNNDFTTHYIVLGYRIRITSNYPSLPLIQHESYDWMTKEYLLQHADVHENTKAYFV